MEEGSPQEYPQDDAVEEDSDFVDSIAYLEVTDYEGGENYQISIYPRREVRIGRDNKCDYTISDSRVSKQHFRIYSIIYEEGQTEFSPLVYCEDLESSNGTYVNDALIGIICRERRGFLLNDGDVIEIRPSWKFQFHQPVHEISFRDATELEDLEVFRDRFTVSDRILGKGTYGAVYLAQEKATLMQMACKIVNLSACAEKHMERRTSAKAGNLFQDQVRRAAEGRKVAMREIKILSQLSHPHIINLKKAFCTPTSLYMITELAPGGDLFSYLESYGGQLDDWHARVISRQVALAIEHLHSKMIAHRDIKPENVLITHTDFGGRVILTDFGFANFADIKTGRLESLVGTSGFVAPEVESDEHRKRGYTLAADLWSLGVLTACLLTGTSLIPRKELSQLSQLEIADRFLGIGDHYTRNQWVNMAPRAQRFLRKLLTTDPVKRMTAAEALGHSWFKRPHSEGILLEERYHKIIRFWKKREDEEDVIEYIRDAPPRSEKERQGPKFRTKLPDTSLSPYFNLDRHLFRRPAATRKVLLANLAESGSAFVVSSDSQAKPIANKSVRRARGVSIISVDAKDMFGKSSATQTADLADDLEHDEIVLVPSEQMPYIESLNLQSSVSSPMSDIEVPQVERDEEDDSRESKRARRESWDPEDRRIHDTIAKELPRYASARVFRDTIKTRKEADRKENIRTSFTV